MRARAEQMKQNLKLRWNRLHCFSPKINLQIESGTYILKTAETLEEILESFKLRHEVFHVEFQGINGKGLDFDKFDHSFDHLIIVHKASGAIIGTYRLSCSEFSDLSYTAQEFELADVFRLEGPFLELGRACIRKDHRRGSVISLLWRGIAEYMNKTNSNVLFGCSSVKVNNARQAALVFKHLILQGAISTACYAQPTPNFRLKHFDQWLDYFKGDLSTEQVAEAEALVPSLLRSYLKLGAKVAGAPAFDKAFDCVDLITILKKEDLTMALTRKFQVAR